MTQQWKPTWEGRTFDHLPTSCLLLWQAQKLDWFPSEKKEKALTNAQRLPNSRELTHQQPTEGATLPAPACDNTCSSSSSVFLLNPFTVIYGALTTVIAHGAARTGPDFTRGSWLSLPGEAGGGTECHSPLASKWMMLINEKLQEPSRQGQLKRSSSMKGHLQFPRVNLTVTKPTPELIWVTKLL